MKIDFKDTDGYSIAFELPGLLDMISGSNSPRLTIRLKDPEGREAKIVPDVEVTYSKLLTIGKAFQKILSVGEKPADYGEMLKPIFEELKALKSITEIGGK